MSFYYGSKEPPPEPPHGSWGETLAIIWAVFRTLALPLGLLFGAIFGLVLLFFAFTLSVWLGLGVIAIGVAALVIRGVWEAKHPPELL